MKSMDIGLVLVMEPTGLCAQWLAEIRLQIQGMNGTRASTITLQFGSDLMRFITDSNKHHFDKAARSFMETCTDGSEVYALIPPTLSTWRPLHVLIIQPKPKTVVSNDMSFDVLPSTTRGTSAAHCGPARNCSYCNVDGLTPQPMSLKSVHIT